MAGLNHFVMETKGHCLFCLKLSHVTGEKKKVHVQGETARAGTTPGGKGMLVEEGEGGNVFSLQRLCHYLRLNMRKVFQPVIALAPASTFPVLERSELKGVLCAGCGGLVETVSEITLELELLQMRLDSLIRRVAEKVSESRDRNGRGLMEEFEKEMLASPQTLLHFGIVEQLRRETLEKSSLLLGRAQPRVMLKRLEDQVMDTEKPRPSSSLPPQPQQLLPGEVAAEEEPELCESVPVISSVQGSYRGNVNVADHDSPGGSPGPPPLQVEAEFHQMVYDEVEGVTESEDPLDPAAPALVPFTSLRMPNPAPPAPVFREMRLDCTRCPKRFKTNRHRLIHERAVHSGIRFQCGLCPSSYTSKSSMQQHRRRFHKAHGQRQVQNYHSWIKSETVSRRQYGNNQAEDVSGPQGDDDESSNPHPELDIEKMNLQLEDLLTMSLVAEDTAGTGTTEHDFVPEQEPSANHPGKTCQYCQKCFPREGLRLDHEKTVHFGMRFQCRICSAKFLYRGSLQRHRKQVHHQAADLQDSKADNPDRKQDSPTPVNGNMEGHLDLPPAEFEMATEDGRRQDQDPLSTSLIIETDSATAPPDQRDDNFYCQLCPAMFRLKSSLTMHRYRNHGRGRLQKANRRKQGGGSIRGKITPSKKVDDRNPPLYTTEERDPLSTLPVNAPAPLKPFFGPSLLARRKKSLNCTICKKSFRRNCERQDHEDIVHYGMKFRCPSCPSLFSSRNGLNLHRRRIHKLFGQRRDKVPVAMTAPKTRPPLLSEPDDPSKKYKCKICHKRFLRNQLLTDHEKTVHQNMKFHCGCCTSTFIYRSSLSKHLKQFHKMIGAANAEPRSSTSSLQLSSEPGTTSTTPQEPHQVQQQSSSHECTMCHKLFKSNKARLWHEARFHQVGRERKYPCGVCPKEFTDASNMRRHRRKVHGPLKNGPNKAANTKRKVKPKPRQQPNHNPFQIGIGNIERIEINKGTEPLPDFLPEEEVDEIESQEMQSPEMQSQELQSQPVVVAVVEDPPNINSSKPFKCQYCDKRFRIIRSLRQHRTVAHLGPTAVRKFGCKLCKKKFILNSHLRRHLRRIHPQG